MNLDEAFFSEYQKEIKDQEYPIPYYQWLYNKNIIGEEAYNRLKKEFQNEMKKKQNEIADYGFDYPSLD